MCSETKKEKKEYVCYPCLLDNIKIEAKQFCQTCKDPEPLCEKCGKEHIRQKLTRGHTICEDMAEFPKLQRISE